MKTEDREAALRKELGIPAESDIDFILTQIRQTGWAPRLGHKEVEGQTLWACPISRGIFQTVDREEPSKEKPTGQFGQRGCPTREIAALEGLKKARSCQ